MIIAGLTDAAELEKEGPSSDLPIALAMIAASGMAAGPRQRDRLEWHGIKAIFVKIWIYNALKMGKPFSVILLTAVAIGTGL